MAATLQSKRKRPHLIGMVHLGPLPGSPEFAGDFDALVEAAVADAITLEKAGFRTIGVENFGDAPFYTDDVPKVTIATMTTAIRAVSEAVTADIGVNVLRNDGLGALAIAAATRASFIRVNVLSGSMWTDQGLIHSRSADIARMRTSIAPDTKIFGDVFVKHATPPPGTDIVQSSKDLVERAAADAVIVSGSGTGSPPTLTMVKQVRGAIGRTPLYLGSGVTAATARRFLAVADGVIVGTALKRAGVTTNTVDLKRAKAFLAAVSGE